MVLISQALFQQVLGQVLFPVRIVTTHITLVKYMHHESGDMLIISTVLSFCKFASVAILLFSFLSNYFYPSKKANNNKCYSPCQWQWQPKVHQLLYHQNEKEMVWNLHWSASLHNLGFPFSQAWKSSARHCKVRW